MAQIGFLDLMDRYASLDANRDSLVEINAAVPWDEFFVALERFWRKPDTDFKSVQGSVPVVHECCVARLLA